MAGASERQGGCWICCLQGGCARGKHHPKGDGQAQKVHCLRTEGREQPLAPLSGSLPPAPLPHSIPRVPNPPCSRRTSEDPQVSLSKGLWDPGGEE